MNLKSTLTALILLSTTVVVVTAQDNRWQQHVNYTLNVQLDVNSNILTGIEKVSYTNNSPDTLHLVYYHLYFNAFQPGSMMDVRSRTIEDPDRRVGNRIANLKENEIGYQHIGQLTQDGTPTTWKINGTVMRVDLPSPLPPGDSTLLETHFTSQVPLQIRRSGRDNSEGIRYSMTQWYPKIAEYDHQGWHADPYVAREFYGVWGNFDVTITLDGAYVVAASGVLQNPNDVGHGYNDAKKKPERGDLQWHFIAHRVHDFAWAADPDYKHEITKVPDGPVIHFFYQDNEAEWKSLQGFVVRLFTYMNAHFGKYPYPVYSIIQGGDGGMEYPMCTLVTGKRSQPSLQGTVAHETAHQWYYGVLGSNESLYPWMDEGFAEFSGDEAFADLTNGDPPHDRDYLQYAYLVKRGIQEPMSEHADHYTSNAAYSIAAYSMGELFLEQLKYIIGEEVFYQGMREYFDAWKFHHPEPNDFIRVMEKASGMQLSWFLRQWIYTTKHIDYGVKSLVETGGITLVTIRNFGEFPMPVEVMVSYKDGTVTRYYIPSGEMLGSKSFHDRIKTIELDPWPWVNPEYTFKVESGGGTIISVALDPLDRTADINRDNDVIRPGDLIPYKQITR